jgi:hypothetical protein
VLAIAGVVVLVAISWAVRERATPAWDQAVYVRNSWYLGRRLTGHGPLEFLSSVLSTTPSRAPLLGLAMVPFVAAFGASASGALMLNVVLWPVLLLGTGAIASRLFGRHTRIVAVVVAATMPLLVGMSHALFQEFLLATLAVVAIWLALRSHGFTDRSTTLAMGAVLGLGVLTKLIFPIYVVGPLTVLAVDAFRTAALSNEPSSDRHRVRTLAVAGSLALGLAGCWYGPNLSATLRYVDVNTSDSSATVGASRSVSDLVLDALGSSISWVFALAALVAFVLVLPRATRRLRAEGFGWPAWRGPLVILSWVVVPSVFVATGKLQTQRYLTGAAPAIAIGIAVLLTRIPAPIVRRVLLTVVVVAGVLQTALLTAPMRLSIGDTDAVTFPTPFGDGRVPLAGQPLGYERLPLTTDHVTPIVRYLEMVTCAAGGAPISTVGLLQTNSVTNDATMSLVAQVRGDQFKFRRQFADPDRLEKLAVDLARNDAILYVPPRDVAGTVGERSAALNRRYYAGSYMTPELLGLFAGPSRSFPIGNGARVQVRARSTCAVSGGLIGR